MIEALILSAAIALVLILGAIALVLVAEIRKQNPTPRRKQIKIFRPEYLTPEQIRFVSGPLPTLFFGSMSIVLIREYGWNHHLTWTGVIMTSIALSEWVFFIQWKPSDRSTTEAPSSDSRPTELQRQLIRMCGGDRELAQRLVDRERWKEGQPEAWYWQAAIDTLIRDRR